MFKLGRLMLFSVFFSLFLFNSAAQDVAAQEPKPLTYPVIITALNSKVPNQTYRNRGEVINYLIQIIKQRKVKDPLTTEIEGLLRQSGATNLLIQTIKDNSPGGTDDGELDAELARLVQQITDQLDNAAKFVAENGGLRKTHDYSIDFLEKGKKATITLDLRGGVGYILVGVCDEDCTDIDIKVLDPSGRVVASDFTVGDVPRVVVEPTRNGKYTVEIMMEACSTEPCLYGLGAFGK